MAEDDTKNKEGTPGYLKKSVPRLITYVARRFNTHKVALARGYVGYELHMMLRKGGTLPRDSSQTQGSR